MSLLIFILVASFVVGLRFARDEQGGTWIRIRKPEALKFKEPVARTYPILYWSAAAHIIQNVVVTAWEFMFSRPWETFTPRYVAVHHLHHTVQFLQRQEKIIFLVLTVVYTMMFVYTIFSKSIRNIITILMIFVGLDVLHVVTDFTGSTYLIMYDLVWTAFTSLVLWSLVMREPNFFKMIRTINKHQL